MKPKIEVNDKTMQCLICDKDCKLFYGCDNLHPNVSGTMFESTGNFGSTLWDLPGRKYLQAVVCDKCLSEKAKQVHVVEYERKMGGRKLIRRTEFNAFEKEILYE